jgi:hypothetical protein
MKLLLMGGLLLILLEFSATLRPFGTKALEYTDKLKENECLALSHPEQVSQGRTREGVAAAMRFPNLQRSCLIRRRRATFPRRRKGNAPLPEHAECASVTAKVIAGSA